MGRLLVLLALAQLVLGEDETIRAKVECETTAGPFQVKLHSSWSPQGVKRFLELVDDNFFTDMLLYRVLEGFLVQFGVAADPSVQAKYQNSRIPDEPKLHKFRPGTLSFAGNGVDSRSCHVFVALAPNGPNLGGAAHETPIGQLDQAGIATFEKVVANHKAAGYTDTGHLQGPLVQRGNAAAEQFPKLDRILSCRRADIQRVEL